MSNLAIKKKFVRGSKMPLFGAMSIASGIGTTSRTLRRVTQSGLCPYASKTAGGHWRYKDCPELRRWITQHQAGTHAWIMLLARARAQKYKPKIVPKRMGRQQASWLNPIEFFAKKVSVLGQPFHKALKYRPIREWDAATRREIADGLLDLYNKVNAPSRPS